MGLSAPGLNITPGVTNDLEPLLLNLRRGIKEDVLKAREELELATISSISKMLEANSEITKAVVKSNSLLIESFSSIGTSLAQSSQNLSTTNTKLNSALTQISQAVNHIDHLEKEFNFVIAHPFRTLWLSLKHWWRSKSSK